MDVLVRCVFIVPKRKKEGWPSLYTHTHTPAETSRQLTAGLLCIPPGSGSHVFSSQDNRVGLGCKTEFQDLINDAIARKDANGGSEGVGWDEGQGDFRGRGASTAAAATCILSSRVTSRLNQRCARMSQQPVFSLAPGALFLTLSQRHFQIRTCTYPRDANSSG